MSNRNKFPKDFFRSNFQETSLSDNMVIREDLDEKTDPSSFEVETVSPQIGRPTQLVNLRKKPSIQSDVIGTVPSSSKVKLLESIESDQDGDNWWKVEVEDGSDLQSSNGYIKAEYIEIEL